MLLAEQIERLQAEKATLLSALRAIEGPSNSLPWIVPYREAGGGYEGLQAIAAAARGAVATSDGGDG